MLEIMENGSDYYPGLSLRVSPAGAAAYISVYGVIAVTAAIGNALVILSFLRYPHIRRVRQNYFLFGLALADMMMAVMAIPMGAIFNRLVISDLTCRALTRSLFFTPAYIGGAVSVFHVMALTADRYIAVTRAIRYTSIMTPRRAICIVVAVWIFGTLLGILPVSNVGGDPRQWVCELQQYEAASIEVYNIAVSSLVPICLAIMFLVYIRIFYVVFYKTNPNNNASVKGRVESTAQRKGRIRATITSAIILLTHTICWLPSSFKYIFESYFATDLRSLLAIQAVCEMLAYGNSAINPIIYGWRNPQFRSSYQKLLGNCLGSSATSHGSRNNRSAASSTAISTITADSRL